MGKKTTTKSAASLTFPDKFQVFSADLSLRRPGFCLLTVEKQEEYRITSIETCSVDNKKSDYIQGLILNSIVCKLKQVMPDVRIPTFFIREKAFNSRGAMNEIGIFKVVGVTDLVLAERYGAEWLEIYPLTVKKLITSTAKSDKKQVEISLRQYVGDHEFKNDDESDAAAVGVAFLIQNGVIQAKNNADNAKNNADNAKENVFAQKNVPVQSGDGDERTSTVKKKVSVRKKQTKRDSVL